MTQTKVFGNFKNICNYQQRGDDLKLLMPLIIVTGCNKFVLIQI